MRSPALAIPAFALGLGLLAACGGGAGGGGRIPVTGQIQASPETFRGSSTGNLNGAGRLAVTTSTGVSCTGDFTHANAREGQGTMVCGDGRSGPFSFFAEGRRGAGHGMLGGRQFTFIFGE